MRFKNFFYTSITPLYWKLFPQKKVETAELFSSVELDSCWQLLHAIPHFKDKETQAQLFLNALEELGHGQMFSDESQRLSEKRPPIVMPPRVPILPEKPGVTDLQRFLLFFHLGETAVYEKFRALSQARIDPGMKAVFRKISEDEEEHGSGSIDLMRKLGGLESLTRMKAGILIEQKMNSLVRFANSLHLPLTIILTVVYFTFGLFIFRRMRSRFLLAREKQLEIFHEQTSRFQSEIRE